MSERQHGIRFHLPTGSSTDVPWTGMSEDVVRAQVRQFNRDAKPGDVQAEVVWRYVSDWQPTIPRYDDDHATSWHELRLYMGPDLFDPVDTMLCEISHPEECGALPPGAVCWVEHDAMRESWPAEPGRYRIRLVDRFLGGSEDGPDYMTVLEVEPIADTAKSDTEVPAP